MGITQSQTQRRKNAGRIYEFCSLFRRKIMLGLGTVRNMFWLFDMNIGCQVLPDPPPPLTKPAFDRERWERERDLLWRRWSFFYDADQGNLRSPIYVIFISSQDECLWCNNSDLNLAGDYTGVRRYLKRCHIRSTSHSWHFKIYQPRA